MPDSTVVFKPLVLLLFIQRSLFKRSYELMNPLGLMCLASYVEEVGYEPAVFSGSAVEALAVTRQKNLDRQVAAVGLYCDFENVSVVESFSRTVKETIGVPVFVGGPQGFALGESFLRSSRCDAVARGEGEETLRELLAAFVQGKGTLQEIAGIRFLDDHGSLVTTPDRKPIADLDALPPQRTVHSVTGPKNNFAVLSGRGCPFNCSFCYAGTVAKKVRLRSVSSVIAEIRQGLGDNPDLKYVWFADDTFTLNEQRVNEFCRELKALRRERDFVWFCDAHPSTVLKWPSMVSTMVDAGLVRMQIGIETGSPRVAGFYNKNATLEQIAEVVHICRDAGLPQLCGNIIIGGAAETEETLEETWEYVAGLMKSAPGMLDITHTMFMPFPGTPIARCPAHYGLRVLDPDALTSTGDYPVIETAGLSGERIAAAYRNFSKKLLCLMKELAGSGAIGHRQLLSHYRFSREYGISSVWHSLVFKRDRLLDRRYTLLSATSARSFDDYPDGEPLKWRPMRVFSLWNAIRWLESGPSIMNVVLSPLEYDLLLLCTGKQTILQLVSKLWQKYQDRYEKQTELKAFLLGILKNFENRHWIVLMPY